MGVVEHFFWHFFWLTSEIMSWIIKNEEEGKLFWKRALREKSCSRLNAYFSTFSLSSHCCGLLTRLELRIFLLTSCLFHFPDVPIFYISCKKRWNIFISTCRSSSNTLLLVFNLRISRSGLKNPSITLRAISKKWMHTFGSSLIVDFSICGEFQVFYDLMSRWKSHKSA